MTALMVNVLMPPLVLLLLLLLWLLLLLRHLFVHSPLGRRAHAYN